MHPTVNNNCRISRVTDLFGDFRGTYNAVLFTKNEFLYRILTHIRILLGLKNKFSGSILSVINPVEPWVAYMQHALLGRLELITNTIK